MGKYDAWEAVFEELSEDPSNFAIEELAVLIPGGLPPSAYKYQAWWASPQNHAVWRAHGWRASPNFGSETVTFTRAASSIGRRPSVPASPISDFDTSSTASEATDRWFVLIGCMSSKRDHAAPARDLYTSPLWQKRRAYAEDSGMPWAILSAEHGLVDPETVLEPYDTFMGDQSSEYKKSWSQGTAERIIERTRQLGINVVEVHAGSHYLENGLIGLLNAAGIKVLWPVEGLKFGEQLAWYTSTASSPTPSASSEHREPSAPSAADSERGPSAVEAESLASELRALADRLDQFTQQLEGEPARPTIPSSTKSESEGDVVALLLAHGETLQEEVASIPEPEFTPDPEANRFLWSDPFAFLVAVIADYQIPAERAWAVPWELRKRIGHFDPARMLEDESIIYEAFAKRPALHRFVKNVPSYILEAARVVLNEYSGDAGRIWSDEPTAEELQGRLQALPGISQKKAAMAVEILERYMGVTVREMEGSDLAFDVHVRRVMLRTGLATADDQQHMIDRARALNPERPGALDPPLWHIGRTWCYAGVPDCDECVLVQSCPKLIDAASGVCGM